MDITGEFRIPAPRQKVWEALNDPEVLRQCIPGCESLEKQADNEFTAKIQAAVGPVKSKFNTSITLTNLNPPQSYTISGQAKSGAAGFAKGGADVALEEDSGETVLRYNARVQPGGKLAQVGSRLMDGTARKLSEQFFREFSSTVAGAGEPAGEEAQAPGPPAVSRGRKGLVVAAAIAVVVIVVAWLAA
ncbi:MAG: carbon monoxide dehydrogenase subunit G [Gammaproteobacteria bacterium]|nr:carbon monoxide dehydrogenase subunit G [Gammaproteobacteria bacterium]NIR84917.1 carbon monoxide dehydrogenase subunit G [Gammaproteobacteria bacterium]NIR91766.1 carbon monoxide dehydrogenase subunit G [Gammaproteobacteria bacterium]NIU05964.1 carbon monoxide dehydrogenase subunit G [Gammaproteobacteria bacterium]NIV53011.1 carbon monoxide dehydrogenase [Gammaproteobacteria bacterium]